MQVLHKVLIYIMQNGFPTPTPIDCNRHGIVMSLVNGVTMCHLAELGNC
jgi:RIO-like serine/threonine protein kinase